MLIKCLLSHNWHTRPHFIWYKISCQKCSLSFSKFIVNHGFWADYTPRCLTIDKHIVYFYLLLRRLSIFKINWPLRACMVQTICVYTVLQFNWAKFDIQSLLACLFVLCYEVAHNGINNQYYCKDSASPFQKHAQLLFILWHLERYRLWNQLNSI